MLNVIQALQPHVTLAVVSNTRSHHLIEGVVTKFGIREHFNPFLTSAGFGFRKPSPKLFESRFKRVAVCRLENVVMIGDSLRKDIRPAKALEMRTTLAKTGRKSRR